MVKKIESKNVTEHVTVKCINCDKEFTGKSQRAQFCSGACKVKFHRYKKQGFTVTSNGGGVSKNTGKYKPDVTVTDQLFIDGAAMRGLVNWYRFDEEVYGRDCWQCKKPFRTRLKLNRYCSPKCRDDAIRVDVPTSSSRKKK